MIEIVAHASGRRLLARSRPGPICSTIDGMALDERDRAPCAKLRDHLEWAGEVRTCEPRQRRFESPGQQPVVIL